MAKAVLTFDTDTESKELETSLNDNRVGTATLTFYLIEESEELEMALNANKMASALFQIRQDVFRPARKHGYSDKAINDLLNKLGEDGEDLVNLLERKFSAVCEERGVLDYT